MDISLPTWLYVYLVPYVDTQKFLQFTELKIFLVICRVFLCGPDSICEGARLAIAYQSKYIYIYIYCKWIGDYIRNNYSRWNDDQKFEKIHGKLLAQHLKRVSIWELEPQGMMSTVLIGHGFKNVCGLVISQIEETIHEC